MTAGGKTVDVRVQRVDNPNIVAIRVWGAHERFSLNRTSTEDGER